MPSFSKVIKKFKPLPGSFVAFDSGGDSKEILVLFHGIAATSATWRPLIEELNLDKYRVIAIDLLGFGGSPSPTCDYDVDDFVKSIRKTLRRLHLRGKFVLIGHSMGSIVAAHYARLYPRKIKAEFLLSLPFYPKEEDFHTVFSRKYTDAYIKAYRALLGRKEFTINTAQTLRNIMRIGDGIDVTADNWDAFRLSLENTIINQNTYNDILKTEQIPISIIYGGLDQFLVFDNVDRLAEFGNVNVKRVVAADHKVGARIVKEVVKQLSDIE